MVHLVTGYAGTEHIKSADQGSFNAAFFGTGQHVLQIGSQIAASIINNNTVRIQDGDILMYGRHIRMDAYEDVTIQTGTAGTKRIDLIVMQYEKDADDGTEMAFLKVIQGEETPGTPTIPEYTDGNILNGATLNQMPLYKVTINGVVLSTVTQLFTTIPTYQALAARYEVEFQEACETYLDSLNILDSKAEIMANTQTNQLAGALGAKEIANECIAVRTFNVASSSWVTNTETATRTDYPYICNISSALFNADSKPIWQMNGVGTIPTVSEREEIGSVLEAVFSSSGIKLYASRRPSCALVLEVKGA